ncbi:hypothetical protein PVAND_014150 [Polypedilum vanderplanki]|uniref:Uncharacterized protein n=1 Tax=Polypedilum vanderplanki TaxID=319348 RepID=A0A9J6CT87_POLVA|nr:hypothetical protein PVAND_014150 [Polypedilum vanderplanki]
MQDYTVDIEDILNENLMPASLMLIEEREQSEWRNLSIKKLDDEFQCITKEKIKDDGSFPTALNSMRYHRKMINEFLCSKFVAEKILEDIQPKKQMFGKRLGEAVPSPEIEYEKNNSLSLDDGQQQINNRPRMLFDEGSYQYKNWLAKTTTLNDIYRTMGISRNFNKPNVIENSDSSNINNRNDQYIDDSNDEEYEEGDVSGFMVQKPLQTPTNGINSFNPNNLNALHAINEKTAGLGNFGNSPLQYPSSISSSLTSSSANFNNDLEGLSKGYQYGPPSAPQQQDYAYGNHHAATFSQGHNGGAMKTINLKDIFEIALTTLAFLSFGMFIVQVIMCISMAKSSDQSMMMPLEMTAEDNEAEAVEMEVRMRRSINDEQFQNKPNPNYDTNVKRINEIARRALRSFEAFVISKHDNGQCLKRFICENNKFSRRTKDLQKFLIPSLGLALSYLSNKLNNNAIISNLDNIQASLIGLGKGNCTRYKCNIKFLNQKRK